MGKIYRLQQPYYAHRPSTLDDLQELECIKQTTHQVTICKGIERREIRENKQSQSHQYYEDRDKALGEIETSLLCYIKRYEKLLIEWKIALEAVTNARRTHANICRDR